ncbi:GNAT family N-acetyltransferase [Streptomyces sp. NBRC 110028]|uniref:GNAT family N-acetyltransferase n=1 Tax=Streptomyces sp. NBRC 110028 TaxID=1621260 RepID=UPI0006E2C45C|nr:GNAT family N-acetyltransferase [Streptomyces sp. NBRC 110028]
MPQNDLQRAVDFRLLFARRQSAEVRPVPGGFLVRHDGYARSHEHNQIHIDGPVEPTELPAVADAAMAGMPHRRITVYDDRLGLAAAPTMTLAGYEHAVEVVMTHTGPVPEPQRHDVMELDLGPAPYGPLWRALAAQQRRWMPDADEETVRQLVGRREARRDGAEVVSFLAAHEENGDVVAWADLYLEPADGIAQIEEVAAAEPFRRRGHANAVLSGALHRAATAGCALRFLVADGEDWPRLWYARRGFVPVGRAHVFTRFG